LTICVELLPPEQFSMGGGIDVSSVASPCAGDGTIVDGVGYRRFFLGRDVDGRVHRNCLRRITAAWRRIDNCWLRNVQS